MRNVEVLCETNGEALFPSNDVLTSSLYTIGSQEMFMKNASTIMKKKRGEIYNQISSSYYGFVDEDDGVLLEEERKREIVEEDYVNKKRIKLIGEEVKDEWESYEIVSGIKEDVKKSIFGGVIRNIPQPSEELIERVVLEKKKREILNALE